MTVVDLIMKLSSLPPDMEVVYDSGMSETEFSIAFKLVPIDSASEIITPEKEHYILLYQKSMLPDLLDPDEE
jgi:hypothetical protein